MIFHGASHNEHPAIPPSQPELAIDTQPCRPRRLRIWLYVEALIGALIIAQLAWLALVLT